jgi:rRNA maturation RNase YbeY
MPIRFFSEEIEFRLKNQRKIRRWVRDCVSTENRRFRDLNFIFCSDKFLLRLNKEFLGHDTFTDIITFDQSVDELISGEVYISVERVEENSVRYQVRSEEELHRVIIHGVLHLCGFRDKSSVEKSRMRKKEDSYLSLWRKSST